MTTPGTSALCACRQVGCLQEMLRVLAGTISDACRTPHAGCMATSPLVHAFLQGVHTSNVQQKCFCATRAAQRWVKVLFSYQHCPQGTFELVSGIHLWLQVLASLHSAPSGGASSLMASTARPRSPSQTTPCSGCFPASPTQTGAAVLHCC